MKNFNKLKERMDKFWIGLQIRKDQLLKNDNRGMGTVEIILIIIVLISLVLIFKTQLTTLVQNLFKKITKQANQV